MIISKQIQYCRSLYTYSLIESYINLLIIIININYLYFTACMRGDSFDMLLIVLCVNVHVYLVIQYNKSTATCVNLTQMYRWCRKESWLLGKWYRFEYSDSRREKPRVRNLLFCSSLFTLLLKIAHFKDRL